MNPNIVYTFADNLYINITNRCTCDCVFCVRNKKNNVGSSENLWLDHEPSVEEVIDELKQWDLTPYGQIVFCGYGEPTERLEELLAIARYLKSVTDKPIRINTNGLSDLSYQKDTAAMMEGLIDYVSISMNAGNAEKYLKVTRSQFGIGSFDALIRFAENCTRYVPKVRLTIVDILSPEETQQCQEISERIHVPLLIRPYEA